MISAFVRLIAISATALILIVFAVVFIRWMGLQQVFAAPPHEWFGQTYWSVFEPIKNPCTEIQNIKEKTTLVLITVQFKNENWSLSCDGKDTPLAEFLKSSSHPNWILHVKSVDSTHLDPLVKTLSSMDQDKRFGILTDSQRAARYMRTKGPQWLFAADSSSMLRMQLFTSLWIETAMDFWPDFVIATNDPSSSSKVSPRLAQELERRGKRIIWGAKDANPSIPTQGRISSVP